jgi:hypothetical protein
VLTRDHLGSPNSKVECLKESMDSIVFCVGSDDNSTKLQEMSEPLHLSITHNCLPSKRDQRCIFSI